MIGQFIQLDEHRGEKTSIESQNRYAYALNNPNKYIDKNGQAAMMMNDGGSGRRKSGGIAGGGRISGKFDVIGAIGSISKIASNAAEERKKALVSGSNKATKITKKEVPKPKRYTAETVCTTRPTPIPSTKCNEATQKVLNFISNASKQFTDKATDYINATYNQVQKLFNDPGQFFTDAWEGIKAPISDPKFWTQTAVAAALAVATGGQSIWVQAIVTGSGYTMTGEGYDFAGTGFDVEKFYELKGVDNAGEYWGGALFDCVLSSGDIYVGRKVFEYVKGGKGVSGADDIIGKINLNQKPNVSNDKLKNIVNDLYKGQGGNNTVGNGTTMDAVRNELLTGKPTNGKFHMQKLKDYHNALQRRLRAGDLNDYDKSVVNALIEDINKALNGQ